MHILDIDLDFFLNRIPSRASDSEERVANGYIKPWNPEKVQQFLESRCGLSKCAPISGRIFNSHHEAFYFWRDLINSGRIKTPFEVTHIDAHADLGLGDMGWCYICGDILHRPINQRMYPEIGLDRLTYPDIYEMTEGNYLAFAVACRWINKITYVTLTERAEDLFQYHFKDNDISSNYLQLKKYRRELLGHSESGYSFDIQNGKAAPLDLEPLVRFEAIPFSEYNNSSDVSFIDLSISPKYTPKDSDKLIPIIEKYIQLDR